MVAKTGLMITHLGGKQEALVLRGFELKKRQTPASKFLPEGESCIPSVVQDRNNQLN
jgi:hypothetical protein